MRFNIESSLNIHKINKFSSEGPHALVLNSLSGAQDYPLGSEHTTELALPSNLGVSGAMAAWSTPTGIRVCGGTDRSGTMTPCKLWKVGSTMMLPSTSIPLLRPGGYKVHLSSGDVLVGGGMKENVAV